MRWPKLKTIVLIGGSVLPSPLLAKHLLISAWRARAGSGRDISTQMLERAETPSTGADALTGLAQAKVSSCGRRC
jgi:hypothetical protein